MSVPVRDRLARERALRDEAARLSAQLRRWEEHPDEVDDGHLQRTVARLDEINSERRRIVADASASPGNTERAGTGRPAAGVVHQPDVRTVAGVRDSARRALDAAQARAAHVPAEAFERAERLVTASDPRTSRAAALWVATAGAEAYERAFAKLLADPTRGHLLWTPEEAQAYRDVEEMRAMSLTDAAGGYLVPFTLDPAILLTSDGSIDPLRRIARVVQTMTDTWSGVTSAGVTGEWLGEAAEAADGSPTLAQPPIPVHKGSCFVPYSYEVGQDAVNFLGELGGLLTDEAAQLQAEAYMNGTGTDQPTGLTVGLGAGSKVPTAAADTLAANDVFGLQAALPPRFQARAQWLSNLETANQLAQFETTGGAKMFPEINDGRLLRKPWNEASFLDSVGDTAAAGNDNVVAYGDFGAGFVIVDRLGTSVELIPNLFGANRRPTGQRGMFMWFRTGSDVVVDNAIRLLTA